MPDLTQRLVGLCQTALREATRVEQQRDRLAGPGQTFRRGWRMSLTSASAAKRAPPARHSPPPPMKRIRMRVPRTGSGAILHSRSGGPRPRSWRLSTGPAGRASLRTTLTSDAGRRDRSFLAAWLHGQGTICGRLASESGAQEYPARRLGPLVRHSFSRRHGAELRWWEDCWLPGGSPTCSTKLKAAPSRISDLARANKELYLHGPVPVQNVGHPFKKSGRLRLRFLNHKLQRGASQ